MSQSRKQSALETAANIGIGYCVSFLTNAAVLPAFGYQLTVRDNIGIGLIYTVISIMRSYILRRAFNSIHARQQ